MQEMIEKFKIKLILLESLSLIFIINGTRRLQIAYNGEKYDALINDDWKKFDGVVFVPEKREVFCSFYDEFNKVAVLIPLIDLNFQNIEICPIFEVKHFNAILKVSKRIIRIQANYDSSTEVLI